MRNQIFVIRNLTFGARMYASSSLYRHGEDYAELLDQEKTILIMVKSIFCSFLFAV